MDWLWTWSGVCFGYRDEDQLRTYDGRHVGRFIDEEVYGPDGLYLGELGSEDRLITLQRKLGRRKPQFRPGMKRITHTRRLNRIGRIMRVGCQDFPAPEDL
ncbi:hypothetical protein [Burkholderia gladioli]|uniref:hypothetical protein n=1 Tax=Burkholderia gladioli TaxID=28095 RepID=UPI0016404687|nr:hypothetical protein [Burkholderia gladioli]